jgi:hypothetical protein
MVIIVFQPLNPLTISLYLYACCIDCVIIIIIIIIVVDRCFVNLHLSCIFFLCLFMMVSDISVVINNNNHKEILMFNDNQLFYTVANFAIACNLSEAAIRSRLSRGSIVAVKMPNSNRLLIPRGYIDKLLNQVPAELR